MKHSLQLKLSQHLTLTPQLQQSIRLLQLSTVELNQELERYLAENPLLERTDLENAPEGASVPANGAEPATDARPAEGEHEQAPRDEAREAEPNLAEEHGFGDEHVGTGSSRRDDEERDDYTQFAAAEPTLHEHLLQQLALVGVTERDKRIAALVVGHLDEDGYLKQELEELRESMLASVPDLEIEELSIALRHVHNMEPTGVGARDIAECLELQLRAMPESTPHRDAAIELVTKHLDILAARDFNKLKRVLAVSEDDLRDIRSLVLTLDPKPGRQFGEGDVRYIVPDVVVRKVGGRWIAALNREAMPRLRINKMYADILQASRENGGKHLAGQLQEARWLIKNVQQRFDTILRVTQSIVDRQKNFFEHGARHHAEVHAHAARHLRAQVLLRQPRIHRHGGRLFRDRHPCAHQAARRRGRREETALRPSHLRHPRPARHPGGPPDRREVPRGDAHPAGQPPQVDLKTATQTATRSDR
jgi:RNA polymerase sigma-54 factor